MYCGIACVWESAVLWENISSISSRGQGACGISSPVQAGSCRARLPLPAQCRAGGGALWCARGAVGQAGAMADAFGDDLFSVFEEDSAATAASAAKKGKAAAAEAASKAG